MGKHKTVPIAGVIFLIIRRDLTSASSNIVTRKHDNAIKNGSIVWNLFAFQIYKAERVSSPFQEESSSNQSAQSTLHS